MAQLAPVEIFYAAAGGNARQVIAACMRPIAKLHLRMRPRSAAALLLTLSLRSSLCTATASSSRRG